MKGGRKTGLFSWLIWNSISGIEKKNGTITQRNTKKKEDWKGGMMMRQSCLLLLLLFVCAVFVCSANTLDVVVWLYRPGVDRSRRSNQRFLLRCASLSLFYWLSRWNYKRKCCSRPAMGVIAGLARNLIAHLNLIVYIIKENAKTLASSHVSILDDAPATLMLLMPNNSHHLSQEQHQKRPRSLLYAAGLLFFIFLKRE